MNGSKLFIFTIFLLSPSMGLGTPTDLKLRGEGQVRYLGIIKVYDAALYAPLRVAADRILDADTSRCLKLDYAVALTAEDFKRGAHAILARQHSTTALARVRAEIEQLHKAYQDVSKGDSYTLCFDATHQVTTLSLNQEELVTIHSAEFAAIYFGIWLGPAAPIDKDLRDALLAPIRVE